MKELNLVSLGDKLEGISNRLRRLERYKMLTLEAYLSDEDTQSIIERLLEQIIQSALDINRAFLNRVVGISLKGKKVPKNSETFMLMGRHKLISPDLAKRMEKSGGFRNVLAHLYDEIIPDKVYEALQDVLTDYPQYLIEVETYLNTLEQTDERTDTEQ